MEPLLAFYCLQVSYLHNVSDLPEKLHGTLCASCPGAKEAKGRSGGVEGAASLAAAPTPIRKAINKQ